MDKKLYQYPLLDKIQERYRSYLEESYFLVVKNKTKELDEINTILNKMVKRIQKFHDVFMDCFPEINDNSSIGVIDGN